MNYINKQYRAKLDNWYICSVLELKLNEWSDVRNGKRSLSGDKLDKFNKLTDIKAKEWINQRSESEKINKWYLDKTLIDRLEMIKEFKVTQTEIANEIGCTKEALCKVLRDPNYSKNIAGMLYYWLNNDGNRRYEQKKKAGRPKKEIKPENIMQKAMKKAIEGKLIEKPIVKEDCIENVFGKGTQLDKNVEVTPLTAIKDENKGTIFEGLREIEDTRKDKNNIALFTKDENGDWVLKGSKEEVWYNQYQTMANKYHETKEELDRYKYLIDKIMELDKKEE